MVKFIKKGLKKIYHATKDLKIEVIAANRENGGCKEFEICGRKPAAKE